jgi:hypothetical protein
MRTCGQLNTPAHHLSHDCTNCLKLPKPELGQLEQFVSVGDNLRAGMFQLAKVCLWQLGLACCWSCKAAAEAAPHDMITREYVLEGLYASQHANSPHCAVFFDTVHAAAHMCRWHVACVYSSHSVQCDRGYCQLLL